MEQYRNELGLPCKSYPLERFDWTVWGVLTAALAVVRVEYRRFISGTTDTNAPARARARSIIGIGDIRKDYKNGKMSIVCVDYHKIYS